MMNRLASIEAILFVAGEEGVRADELSRLLEISEDEVMQALHELKEQYLSRESCALSVIDTAKRFKLVTKKEYAEVVKSYAHSPASGNLTKAILEVLSIIAYKQPVTRMEIDEIRGVQSSGAVQKLSLHGLIAEKGRLKTPGRPVLYGTTDAFLDYFGLKSLEELPELSIDEEEKEDNLFFETFQKTFEE